MPRPGCEGAAPSGVSATSMLGAWEVGEGLAPLDRDLALLWAGGANGDLAALPIAERDRRILALRAATFGDGLDCIANCPGCGAALEFTLSVRELSQLLSTPGEEEIERNGYRIHLRPIDSSDLAAAAALPAGEAVRFLRHRACPQLDDLPAELAAEVEARIVERERAGEVELALACGRCGHDWAEPLDVGAHVWVELSAASQRVLREVAELAAAFGWSEADILGLSERRRRAYLALTRGA